MRGLGRAAEEAQAARPWRPQGIRGRCECHVSRNPLLPPGRTPSPARAPTPEAVDGSDPAEGGIAASTLSPQPACAFGPRGGRSLGSALRCPPPPRSRPALQGAAPRAWEGAAAARHVAHVCGTDLSSSVPALERAESGGPCGNPHMPAGFLWVSAVMHRVWCRTFCSCVPAQSFACACTREWEKGPHLLEGDEEPYKGVPSAGQTCRPQLSCPPILSRKLHCSLPQISR